MIRKRILAIEDSLDIRNLLRHVLSKDFDLVMEESGDEGLKAAVNFNPDLIILDLGLPEMDGFELCDRFRRLPDLEHTPIIITATNYSSLMNVLSFIKQNGPNLVLEKFDYNYSQNENLSSSKFFITFINYNDS